MKALTLRFSDRTHQVLREAAAIEGVNLSQFLREAALVRAVWVQAANGGYQDMHDIYATARQLLDAEDKRRRPRPD